MTSVYTFSGGIESLDTIIKSIKEKLLYYGADIKWKIDLTAITTNQEYPKKRVFTPIAPSLTRTSDFSHISNSEIESKSGQSCDTVIQQIKEEAAIEQSLMKNIYLRRQKKDELRHLKESNMKSVKIKKLQKALIKAEEILKNMYTVQIPKENFEKDIESLLIEKQCLLKKLKEIELRLDVQEALRSSSENEDNTVVSTIEEHTTVIPIPEYSNSPISDSNSISFTSERSISPYSRRSSIYSATEHNTPSSPTEYNNSIHSATEYSIPSPQTKYDNTLLTTEYDTTTKYNILPTATKDFRIQTFPVASLGTLADRLLKSTQQQSKKQALTHTSSERSFVKEKRKLSDHDPVMKTKKLKTVKLTYKDQWTEDEDSQLLYQVRIFGIDNWEKVSKALLYRSSTECLRRFQQINCTLA